MIGFQNQAPLKSLTTHSSLAMLMRALYRMGLNYCVLPPAADCAYLIVFTKEQLVSLIERSNPEIYISEIPKRVTQGLFKPVAIFNPDSFKPDSPSSDFVSNGGFTDPEGLQVLLIGEEGAQSVSLKEALSPKTPDFPEWWEAPVPFVMFEYGKVHLNRTAMLMFGSDLKRMPVSDVPDKNEFLVMLEGGESPCSVTFHRLEGDIFILEDSTSDMPAAEEVAWWAAVGKAWAASLELEQRVCVRCNAEEAERFRSEAGAEAGKIIVLPCEWGGELLGYFCAGPSRETLETRETRETRKKTGAVRKASSNKTEASKSAASASRSTKPKPQKEKKIAAQAEAATPENEVLSALGPQAMGLLTPGTEFPSADAKESLK